jgi:hypothetical protein
MMNDSISALWIMRLTDMIDKQEAFTEVLKALRDDLRNHVGTMQQRKTAIEASSKYWASNGRH